MKNNLPHTSEARCCDECQARKVLDVKSMSLGPYYCCRSNCPCHQQEKNILTGISPAKLKELEDGGMQITKFPQEKAKEESWEEAFDSKFGGVLSVGGTESMDYFRSSIKVFIEDTLREHREELAGKVEALKKPRGLAGSHCTSARKLKRWNAALDAVLALLTTK